MPPNTVYLLHPTPQFIPDIGDWIAEVEDLVRAEPGWNGWSIHAIAYNKNNGFEVQPLFVRVLQKPGPVLLLESVQNKALAALREKLGTLVVVIVRSVGDAIELWEALEEAKRRHSAGEPLLARKMVVAVLIVRKLRHLNRWAGNDKGYLWQYDVAKGRGIPANLADITQEVVNDLLLHHILVYKTSQGLKKYALNPKLKKEVHAIADSGVFQNKHLETVLLRDRNQVQAYYLYQSHTPQAITIRQDDGPTHQHSTAAHAISYVRSCPDAVRYEARIQFDNGKTWTEHFTEKRILIEFLEAFG